MTDNPTWDAQFVEEFERQRPHLRAIAYRMLGSLTEADDAVQETWLRVSRVPGQQCRCPVRVDLTHDRASDLQCVILARTHAAPLSELTCRKVTEWVDAFNALVAAAESPDPID